MLDGIVCLSYVYMYVCIGLIVLNVDTYLSNIIITYKCKGKARLSLSS